MRLWLMDLNAPVYQPIMGEIVVSLSIDETDGQKQE